MFHKLPLFCIIHIYTFVSIYNYCHKWWHNSGFINICQWKQLFLISPFGNVSATYTEYHDRENIYLYTKAQGAH